jgi:SNF2 family DNA or RNA helicase
VVGEYDDSPLPERVAWRDQLHPFQRVGARWLATLGGGILGDQPGLGKTIQALTVAEILKPASLPVLIVCPAYVIESVWADEIQKWLPGARVAACVGSPKRRHEALAQGAPYTIINYEMLRRSPSGECPYEEVFQRQWGLVIFDEGHRIHNRNASQSKGATELRYRYPVILTGTPVWNKPDSLWHLLHLLDPARFSSYWQFVNTYCLVRDTPWAKEIVGPKVRELPRLRRAIQPYLLRRLKAQVAPQLPPKIYRPLPYTLTVEQAKAYNTVEKDLRLTLEAQNADQTPTWTEIQFTSTAASLATLRRICNSPALVDPRATVQSAKLQVIRDLLQDIIETEQKVLIFLWHRDFGKLLRQALQGQGFEIFYLDGNTPAPARASQILEFKLFKAPAVLIGTIGALGTGLSIPEATSAIFAEMDWTPANNEQAEDRIHRIVGTTQSPTIYHVFARGTIEEDIYKVAQTKASMADKVLAIQEVVKRLLVRTSSGT